MTGTRGEGFPIKALAKDSHLGRQRRSWLMKCMALSGGSATSKDSASPALERARKRALGDGRETLCPSRALIPGGMNGVMGSGERIDAAK